MTGWTPRATREFMTVSLAQARRKAGHRSRGASPGSARSLTLLLSPLRDFALDRFGDIGPDELPDVIVDRLDQLGAGAYDDGLEMRRELRLEAGIDKQIEPLQHLHRDLLGERVPARVIARRYRAWRFGWQLIWQL